MLRNYDTDAGDDTDASHLEEDRLVSPPHPRGIDSPRPKSGSSNGSEAEREANQLKQTDVDRRHMVRRSLDRADDLEHSIAGISPTHLRLTLERKAIRLKMEIIDWMNVRPQPAHRLDRRCLCPCVEWPRGVR